jgi:hypothetical protein
MMKRTPLKPGTTPLKRTTTLKATTGLKAAATPLRRTKPLRSVAGFPPPKKALLAKAAFAATTVTLRAKPERISEARAYHAAVFARFGSACVLCEDRSHPATEAAHVIKRSTLGRLRFADVAFARPAHTACHRKQEANLIRFSASIRRSATLAYNALTRNSPKVVPVD